MADFAGVVPLVGKVWIIGSSGTLGTELVEALEALDIPYIATGREVDVSDLGAVTSFAVRSRARCIINCAAYTDVDGAEANAHMATLVNAVGPENVGTAGVSIGARVIHISTDYVFDGDSDVPYLETNEIAPLGSYGKSKAEGESRLFAIDKSAVIIRTSWLYGKKGRGFVAKVMSRLAAGEAVAVADDQIGSPTWAADLAGALAGNVDPRVDPIAKSAAERTMSIAPGIYHYSNSGNASRYDFACEIRRLGLEFGLFPASCVVYPVKTEPKPGMAMRPGYSVLGLDKARRTGLSVRSWRAGLRAYFMRDIVR